MSAPAHHRFTLPQYMRLVEHVTDVKLEYADGYVVAMAGGSPRHNLLATRVLVALSNAVEGSLCRAFNPDQAVATADGLYTYPDVSLVCGPLQIAPATRHVTNPTVLVEVLSDSTRDYDEGEKLARYKTIPALRDVLLVEQDHLTVVHHHRDGDRWTSTRHEGAGAVVRLTGVAAELRLDAIYRGAFDLPG